MIQIGKPAIGDDEINAVAEVLRSGNLVQGETVERFERALEKYCDYKYAICVNSGTAALHVSVIALGLRGRVAVPDFTFAATANAPKFVGAEPVFVDVDKKTFNMNPQEFEKVSGSVETVIPVSLFGQAYDVDAIRRISKENGIKIVSDNCQSIGAEWKGKRNFGDDLCVLSFYPTKNITTGEGGAILTDDKEICEACKSVRNHGQKERYLHERLGFNYRMTDIAAAIGLEQLKKIDAMIERRVDNAKLLTDLLEGSKVETPFIDSRCKHVFNQYTIKTGEREKLIKLLTASGIGYCIYYPRPLHAQPSLKNDSKCPVADYLCKNVLSLPIHPGVSEDDIHKIADVVKKL